MDEPLDCERLPHDSDRGRHPCPRGGDESIGLLQHAATTMESRGEERRPRGRKRARRQRLADVRIAEGVCRSPRPDRSAGDALLRRHVPAHLPDGRPHPVRQLAGTRVEGLPVYYLSCCLALRIKTTLVAFLYRKVLTAWSTGGEQRSAGEVINSITLDTDKVYQAVLFAGELWGAPLRLLITMAMLWQYLGPSCLVAVGVVMVVLFCSFFFARRVQVVQTLQMEKKDKRVKYVHELFSGIKILKLYAWEEPFQQRVVDVRKAEMEMLRKIAFYFSLMNFVWNCISFLVSLVTFMTFLMVGSHGLDPVTAFVSLALFNTLRFSLLLIPDLIVGCVVCNVAMGRMKEFLLSEDVDPNQVGNQPYGADAVTIRQASFSWHRQERLVLQDVDVRIAQGQLVAVVGQVGCGKTSFLSAILGELRCVKGSINRKGKVAYVAQQAWIQNATVRQNILLKRQHHSCFYDRVILACQLQTDLAELPAGDQTELGMRGVNLSGGQKQRINLARAVYQNADLYIMDDPLSAVDAQVGSALFHGVIGPRGLLRKKTRVLATNTLSLLPLTDMVIVLHEGRVKEVHRAPFGQRLFEKGLALKALIAASPPSQQPQHHGTTDGGAARAPVKVSHDEKSYDVTSGDMSSLSVTMAKRPNPQGTLSGYAKPGQLIEDEAFHVGKVEYEIYRDYVKRFGPVMFVVMLLSYAACRAFDVLSSVWISSWSEEVLQVGGNASLPDSGWRLSVYGLLGVCQGLAIFLGTLVLGLCALAASGSLHDEALGRLVRAPMSFFDTTPLGRMLNRFSKDLDQADIQIGLVVDCVLEQLSDVLGILLLITLYIPTFLPAVAPCALVYFVVQKLFVRTFRQLQRLESVSRSPVFNCIAETVPGVQTIRAYAVQRAFVALTDALLERWISCAFHLMAAERWLTVRLNFLGTAVSLVTACLLVHGRDSFGAAVIGLTLLYSLRLTDALNFLVRFTAELENSLISVERLHEYTKTPTEAPWRVTPAPSSDWPQEGAVQFVNFSTRYRKDLDLVLRHINLEIQPSEKVGVVGRTGSGKSSLTLSMFRILEPAEGDIVIDGVAISRIGLHDLRSKITIIPQEPILFCGSLRLNLDPKGERTDDQVWAALNKAHLSTFFQDKAEKLDFVIEEDGKNLSIGQHQLICLARALLRNTRLLILDEATASVDPDTDVLVQQTIRRDFAHCTVLTVAHRLQTILDADRIVVMKSGEIQEVGVPADLLRNHKSAFYAMAREAGLGSDDRSSGFEHRSSKQSSSGH
ncbi:multidrug resistance-associated protein 1-like isoform X3 [Dermacentor albipictus]|uniref:multidrug resistance-associated protein 1-like isoform X3 n=1 Tax=Dermacentor albipictus TaxID=60249 RepID=UPI0038FBEC57